MENEGEHRLSQRFTRLIFYNYLLILVKKTRCSVMIYYTAWYITDQKSNPKLNAHSTLNLSLRQHHRNEGSMIHELNGPPPYKTQ